MSSEVVVVISFGIMWCLCVEGYNLLTFPTRIHIVLVDSDGMCVHGGFMKRLPAQTGRDMKVDEHLGPDCLTPLPYLPPPCQWME